MTMKVFSIPILGHILDTYHFTYKAGHSSVTAFFRMCIDIVTTFGKGIILFRFDLSAAFDLIDHEQNVLHT